MGHLLSDVDYAAVWRDRWELEDDVAFSSTALDRDLLGSVPGVATFQAGFGVPCVTQPGGCGTALWWASLTNGPDFQAPYVARHLLAYEFHESLIVSLVLNYFVPVFSVDAHGVDEGVPSL
ncbi:unnamed protein product [Calypogeia fissa]